jgi:hypothetical protein
MYICLVNQINQENNDSIVWAGFLVVKGSRILKKDGDLFITKNLLSKFNIYELIDLK